MYTVRRGEVCVWIQCVEGNVCVDTMLREKGVCGYRS